MFARFERTLVEDDLIAEAVYGLIGQDFGIINTLAGNDLVEFLFIRLSRENLLLDAEGVEFPFFGNHFTFGEFGGEILADGFSLRFYGRVTVIDVLDIFPLFLVILNV